jgi:hypothetical protein
VRVRVDALPEDHPDVAVSLFVLLVTIYPEEL